MTRKMLAVLIALGALTAALMVGSQTAGAAVFTVTRKDDPNPDGCKNNDCSLREAVIRANNKAGPDTIVLGSGRYVLRVAGRDENDAETGDLDIKKRVTIMGNGPGRTLVDANDIDRVFEVRDTAQSVLLKNLSITGGEVDATSTINPATPDGGGGLLVLGEARLQNVHVIDNASPNCCGGGIYNNGKLTLVNSRVTQNSAFDCCGGGIANVDGRLIVRNSRVDYNRAHDCCGGGLWNSHEGRVTIFRSMIDHNNAPDCCGGGIWNEDDNSFIKMTRSRVHHNNADGCCGGGLFQREGGDTTIVRSRFDHNTADSCCGGALYNDDLSSVLVLRRSQLDNNLGRNCCGGGLFNRGTGKVIRTVVRDNLMHRDCCGGGIFHGDSGALTLRDSVLRGNRSTGESGGGLGGGLYLAAAEDTKITGSTIAGNFSSTTGGGIFIGSTGPTTLLNSTISGNRAFGAGGGIFESGAGLVELTNITVVDNRGRGSGGGVSSNGAFDVFKSIIANNSPDDCDAILPGATGRNLDRDSSCFAGAGSIHANPRVLGLGNNGGPTPTHALRLNSPAIDAVSAGGCPPPARDQRGVKRPKNGDGQGGARCDLGAYERKP